MRKISKISKVYRPLLHSKEAIDSYIEGVIEEKKAASRRRPRISESRKEEVRDLLLRGFSHREISRRTGVGKGTIARLAKEMGQDST